MTIVVLGCKRGGTSLVAGVLRKLGVFMGQNMSPHGGHEDTEISQKEVPEIIEMIHKRSKEFDTWGWKDPDCIDYIHYLIEYLKDPVFLVVFRDPMATAMSEAGRQQGKPLSVCLWEAKIAIKKLVDFALQMRTKGYHVLALSHEKAIVNPEEYVKQLARMLNLKFNQDAVDFINPAKGYQNV